MNRRAFVTGLGAVLAAPLAAGAQQVGKVPRIGFLQISRTGNVGVFIQALREAGYIDGQNAVIVTRIYEGALVVFPNSQPNSWTSNATSLSLPLPMR